MAEPEDAFQKEESLATNEEKIAGSSEIGESRV
jgi:hypothetical protein